MKIVQGDLIELAKSGEFNLIAHGCNCKCQMGKGIALTIKKEFPEAYKVDCQTVKGDESKMGTCSVAECLDGKLTVVNAYTQYHWKGKAVLANYDAIRSCMRWIKENYPDKKIGLPKIGAGLAKGDWNTIQSIMEEELNGLDVTLVEYQKS